MNPGDEPRPPATADSPPPPENSSDPGAGLRCAPAAAPTPAAVLRWVAAGGSDPWFPSAHAKLTGTPRDSLDDPLTELRVADLVKIVAWVRGVGQGYALTPAGQAAVSDPSALAHLGGPADSPALPVAAPAADPDGSASARPEEVEFDPPVVTPTLLIATVLWFFVGLVYAARVGVPVGEYLWSGNAAVLERLGAVTGPNLLRGEWWRLLSNCLVHVGAVHLVLNMFVLGTAGPLAELFWGRGRLAVIYVFSGLAGSCLAMALRPLADSGAVALLAGASGAVWGVTTSLLAWLLLFRSQLQEGMGSDLLRRLALMFVVNGAVNFLPQVSWQAHLGGGVAGFLTAWLLNAAGSGGWPQRLAALLVLAALPVAFVGVLLSAMQSGGPWAVVRERVAAEEAVRQKAEEDRRKADEQAHRRALAEQVGPLLDQLIPARVRPVEEAARWALIGVPRRGVFERAAVRARVVALRAVAADALAGTSGPPTGFAGLDRQRAQVRALATARVKEFDLLLSMFATPGGPDRAAWQAWGDARREAERLWDEIAAQANPKSEARNPKQDQNPKQ